MPGCKLCSERDHEKRLEYAPLSAVYVHRHCLLRAAADDPWREPVFSWLFETRLYQRVPGRPAIACRRGHALTEDNVIARREHGRSYRKCRICERARQRRGSPARGEADRRRRARQRVANGERTHCKNGHEYTAANIVSGRCGSKQCRDCLRAAGHAAYAKRWGWRLAGD